MQPGAAAVTVLEPHEIPLFQSVDAKKLESLSRELRVRPFESGEYLYFESQPAESLWIVRSGEVRTLKATLNGRVTTLEMLRPGGLFGLASVLPSAAHSETAQGVVSGETWSVPRRVLARLMQEHPEIGRDLLGIVSLRLQRAHDRLCSFAHDGVPARLARSVLDEAEDGRVETTRRALGEAAGTTVETAIRVLRNFEKRGWVEGGVGWVRILDEEALERIASGEASP